MEAVEGDDMELYTVDVCVFSVWVCLICMCVSSLLAFVCAVHAYAHARMQLHY